jgi:beta-glucanase (GH16 family)
MTPASLQSAEPGPPRKLDLSHFQPVWHDEFDGDRLDSSHWQALEMVRQGHSRWVPSLVNVRGGVLHLGIRRTGDPVIRYECGAVQTRRDFDPAQTLFQQRYGYFEARCRLPRHLSADYWGAFWMMAGRISDDSPDTREGLEVDIMESFQFAHPAEYSVAFHWNGYGKNHNAAGLKCGTHPELLDGNFHTYGLYWDERYYVVFLDGVEAGRTELLGLGSDQGSRLKSAGPCRQPGFLILSCEAAPWAGASPQWEKDMPAEDEFLVDYVRVYQGTLPLPSAP